MSGDPKDTGYRPTDAPDPRADAELVAALREAKQRIKPGEDALYYTTEEDAARGVEGVPGERVYVGPKTLPKGQAVRQTQSRVKVNDARGAVGAAGAARVGTAAGRAGAGAAAANEGNEGNEANGAAMGVEPPPLSVSTLSNATRTSEGSSKRRAAWIALPVLAVGVVVIAMVVLRTPPSGSPDGTMASAVPSVTAPSVAVVPGTSVPSVTVPGTSVLPSLSAAPSADTNTLPGVAPALSVAPTAAVTAPSTSPTPKASTSASAKASTNSTVPPAASAVPSAPPSAAPSVPPSAPTTTIAPPEPIIPF